MNALHRENDLWQHIRHLQDPNERRARVLELIHHLLRQTRLEKQEIAYLDEDDLEDLLLEYQQIGKQVEQFLGDSLPQLDPTWQGDPFEQQLQNLQASLQKVKQDIQTAIHQQQQLSEQKSKLDEEVEQLEKEQQAWKIQDQAVKQIKNNIIELKQSLVIFQKANSDENVNQQIAEAHNIQQQHLETLLKIIPPIVAKLQENYHLYKNHFSENECITEALQAESVSSVTRLSSQQLKELQHVSQEVKQELQHWDLLLQQILK